MTRQLTSKTQTFILGAAITVAAAGLITTALLFFKSGKEQTVDAAVTDSLETICVAGAYEKTNGRFVIDMFAPTIGVETIEDISKETYDHIISEIGSC